MTLNSQWILGAFGCTNLRPYHSTVEPFLPCSLRSCKWGSLGTDWRQQTWSHASMVPLSEDPKIRKELKVLMLTFRCRSCKFVIGLSEIQAMTRIFWVSFWSSTSTVVIYFVLVAARWRCLKYTVWKPTPDQCLWSERCIYGRGGICFRWSSFIIPFFVIFWLI